MTVQSGTLLEFHEAVAASLARHGAALGNYLKGEMWGVALSIVKFLLLAAGFLWIRRLARGLSTDETDLIRESRVLEKPFAFALLLSLAGSLWIFPHAPRFLWALLGSLALLSSVSILRRRIQSELAPFVCVLLVLLTVDGLRELGAGVYFWPRMLFLAKMLAAFAFCGWMLRSSRRLDSASEGTSFTRTVTFATCVGLVLSAAALIAELAGHESLARLFGDTLLQSAYLAILLYAAVEALDGIARFTVALGLPGASDGWLHRFTAHGRLRHGVWSIGVLLWLATLLKWIWLPFLAAL